MSTISSPANLPAAGAAGIVHAARTTLKRCWLAYINWRIEQLACSMGDRELGDRTEHPAFGRC